VNTTTTAQASPFTINSITTSNGSYTTDQKSSLSGSLSTGNGIVGGTSTTNGITYNNYAFGQTSTWGTYTIGYTTTESAYVYVLAVAGGGSGGYNVGGGGGGGGVVMNSVLIPTGTNTIGISLGPGGTGISSGSAGINGTNTTVTFNASTSNNIIAKGGGGGNGNSLNGIAGGSSGGNGGASGSSTVTAPITTSYNYGNSGGGSSTGGTGGGGGAGTSGGAAPASNVGGNGGNGIRCSLPGITNFTPSGTSYGTYYWGGGGGGVSNNTSSTSQGTGGLGGGGGGGNDGSGVAGSGGSGGINVGNNGINNSTTKYGGDGGANTGGGGGGCWVARSGSGGSGIVVIAFPGATVPVVTLTVTSVSSTGFTLNFASVTNASSYVLYVNNVLYGSALTADTNNTITQTSTTGWFIIDFYAKNVGGTLIAEGHSNYFFDITPFTTVTNSSNNKTVLTVGPTSAYNSTTDVSVVVDNAQAKMLFANSNGVWYATSSNAGVSWSGLTQLVTSTAPFGANAGGTCCISPDGTKGLFFGSPTRLYSINWSGSTPTATSISTSVTFFWSSCSITASGLIALIGGCMNPAYYLTWNTSTSQFNAPISLGINTPHMAVAISQDGKTLLADGVLSGSNLGYISVNWSGANPPVPTLNTTWQSLGAGTNMNLNGGSMCFVGGNINSPSTYVIAHVVGLKYFLYTWNSSNNTLTYVSTIPVTDTGVWNFATTLSGTVLYYVAISGSNWVINSITLSVA
jgi:hypothetical protein